MTDIRKKCRLTDVKRELIGAMFRYSSQNPRCQDTKKTWESVVSLIPSSGLRIAYQSCEV